MKEKKYPYEVVIGLEVHAQLATNSKIFCGCSTQFGAEPNSQVCPICLGMPGTLPVLNEQVVAFAIKMGLATHSEIRHKNEFARKNYFYADLPKGYQISQFDKPICENGYLEIECEDGNKKIGITRIHMEEDAGKSVHDESYVKGNETLIDLNRCGVPLIEIVSEPDIRSPQQAAAYLTKMRQLVRYLKICDGNMDQGSLRCDANISLRPYGQKEFGTKAELKNMNSIRNVEKALEYEIKRQSALLQAGESVIQQTLLWDPDKNEAKPMRGKEESHDYRYFPEPDLVPIVIEQSTLQQAKEQLPELPDAKFERFIKVFKLPVYDTEILTAQIETADFYEAVVTNGAPAKMASNWVMGEVLRIVNEQKIAIEHFPVSPQRLAGLLISVEKNIISSSAAKKVFEKMLTSTDSVETIIEKEGLKQISDSSALEQIVDTVLAENPKDVADFKAGNKKVIGFFVGQVMRGSKGKADPKMVNQILQEKLNSA